MNRQFKKTNAFAVADCRTAAVPEPGTLSVFVWPLRWLEEEQKETEIKPSCFLGFLCYLLFEFLSDLFALSSNRRRHSFTLGRTASRSKKNVHNISHELLIRDSFDRLGRKFNVRPKMCGDFAEQLDACGGIQLVAPEQCLQCHSRLRRRHALMKARRQVRMLAQ
jgi:hypothetical protein